MDSFKHKKFSKDTLFTYATTCNECIGQKKVVNVINIGYVLTNPIYFRVCSLVVSHLCYEKKVLTSSPLKSYVQS